MKIKIILLVATCLLINLSYGQFYNIPFNSYTGASMNTNMFIGKKVIVVTLPVHKNNSSDSFLKSLDSFYLLHKDSISVVASPSIEDGFLISDSSASFSWYRTFLKSGEIITRPVYTHKESDRMQHPLFAYLTRISENMSFQVDAATPLVRYFISKSGELYGVLDNTSRTFGVSTLMLIRM